MAWTQSGSTLSYTLLTQSGNGNTIIAYATPNFYYTTNGGTSWNTSSSSISGIISLSVSGNGTIAYACTTSNVYSSTDFSSWTVSSLFSSFTKTYNSVIVSDRVGTSGINRVFAGTTQGLIGIPTSVSASTVQTLDDGNTTRNW